MGEEIVDRDPADQLALVPDTDERQPRTHHHRGNLDEPGIAVDLGAGPFLPIQEGGGRASPPRPGPPPPARGWGRSGASRRLADGTPASRPSAWTTSTARTSRRDKMPAA